MGYEVFSLVDMPFFSFVSSVRSIVESGLHFFMNSLTFFSCSVPLTSFSISGCSGARLDVIRRRVWTFVYVETVRSESLS